MSLESEEVPSQHKRAPRDQSPDQDTDTPLASKVTQLDYMTHQVANPRLSLVDLAYMVAGHANRADADRRDAECRCPGRAYVAHSWDLDAHRDGCPAGYEWVSVAAALDVLRRMPRRKLARLLAGIR